VLELKLIQFSIEAMMLQAPWSQLLTARERAIANARLQAVGFSPDDLKQPDT